MKKKIYGPANSCIHHRIPDKSANENTKNPFETREMMPLFLNSINTNECFTLFDLLFCDTVLFFDCQLFPYLNFWEKMPVIGGKKRIFINYYNPL